MRSLIFTKMVASGNDFIVLKSFGSKALKLKVLARRMCDRKFGIGADGLLLLEKSRVADVKMRIFNADGSEAEMCGNGARCVALYKVTMSPCFRREVGIPTEQKRASGHHVTSVTLQTKAGIIEAQVHKDSVKIKLTDPRNIRLDIPIKVHGRLLHVNFVNTGVPHAVIFVNGLQNIDVAVLGREIRYHKEFAPAGSNVNFVEAIDKDSIAIRTYERGVEAETLACGTGSSAAALVFALKSAAMGKKVNVLTQSKETLSVYFQRKGRNFRNVWLEGKARIVYKGVYVYAD